MDITAARCQTLSPLILFAQEIDLLCDQPMPAPEFRSALDQIREQLGQTIDAIVEDLDAPI